MRRSLLLSIALTLTVASPAFAGVKSFYSPSNNISCEVSSGGERGAYAFCQSLQKPRSVKLSKQGTLTSARDEVPGRRTRGRVQAQLREVRRGRQFQVHVEENRHALQRLPVRPRLRAKSRRARPVLVSRDERKCVAVAGCGPHAHFKRRMARAWIDRRASR
jgi:hypothetical protein